MRLMITVHRGLSIALITFLFKRDRIVRGGGEDDAGCGGGDGCTRRLRSQVAGTGWKIENFDVKYKSKPSREPGEGAGEGCERGRKM